ncbi:proteoglycan 4 [Alligator mississippiensis]|uniref:proteoglycan 4 n=1 Tax=Alligator mississippiensis TaxID=8496 RepID=UPI0028772F89|nr:proteoglycan 4 [Alligator mississippiensis]
MNSEIMEWTIMKEKLSCRGRCFEAFVRGRECDCDADCEKYGKCCSDYNKHCKEVHTVKSSHSSATTPLVNKSTTKRSPKNGKKRTPKKVVESHEVMEEQELEKSQIDGPGEIYEEVGSGLDNVEIRPSPITKEPDEDISRLENKGTTVATLSEDRTSQTPTSQSDKTSTHLKMATTKPLTTKMNLPPSTPSMAKVSTLPTTIKDTRTTALKVTTTADKGKTVGKQDTTTADTKPTTIAKTSTTTAANKATTATVNEVTTPAIDVVATDKKSTTTAGREETTAIRVTTTAPRVATVAAKDTTTAGGKATTTAKRETTADKKDMTPVAIKDTTTAVVKTTTTKKDTTAVGREPVSTIKIETLPPKIATPTVGKGDVTTGKKQTPPTSSTTVATTDKKDTTTAEGDTVTRTTKTDATRMGKVTVTATDEKDTTEAATAKKETTPIDKEIMTTNEKYKTTVKPDIAPETEETVTTAKKDITTVGKETVMSPDERDVITAKPVSTPVARETVKTTTKLVTTPAAEETVTTTKKDTTTVSKETVTSPDERDVIAAKPVTTPAARQTVKTTTKLVTTPAAEETITTAKTDTTTVGKETIMTTNEKDITTTTPVTPSATRETVKTSVKPVTTAVDKGTVVTPGEKDTITAKPVPSPAARETVRTTTNPVITTMDKGAVTKTDEKDPTTLSATKDTTTVVKDAPKTADEKVTVVVPKKISMITTDKPDRPPAVVLSTVTIHAAGETVTPRPAKIDTTTKAKDILTTTKKETTTANKEIVTIKDEKDTMPATTDKKDTTSGARKSIMTTVKDTLSTTKQMPSAAKETTTTVAIKLTTEGKETTTIAEETTTESKKSTTVSKETTTGDKKDTTTAARETSVADTRETTTAGTRETPSTDKERSTDGKKEFTTVTKDKIAVEKKEKEAATRESSSTEKRQTTTVIKETTPIDKKETPPNNREAITENNDRTTSTTPEETPTTDKVSQGSSASPIQDEPTVTQIPLVRATAKTTIDQRTNKPMIQITDSRIFLGETPGSHFPSREKAKTVPDAPVESTTGVALIEEYTRPLPTQQDRNKVTSPRRNTISPLVEQEGRTMAKTPFLTTEKSSPYIVTEKRNISNPKKGPSSSPLSVMPHLEATVTVPTNFSTMRLKEPSNTKVQSKTTEETFTKGMVATPVSTETTQNSAHTHSRHPTTKKNTPPPTTENLQKPTRPIILEQEEPKGNTFDPTPVPDRTLPHRNTGSPKETPDPFEVPTQNPHSPKEDDFKENPETLFTTAFPPNPKGSDASKQLKSSTPKSEMTTTTNSNPALSRKQETTHSVTANPQTDLVSDRETTKKSPTDNTSTSVKYTVTTSTYTTDRTAHHIPTLPSRFIRNEEREVKHFPTETPFTSYSTKAPERSTMKHANFNLSNPKDDKNKPLVKKDDSDGKNLCNKKPADGMVALQNGTLAVFRGHYYWLLNPDSPPTVSPRKISEVWGIPSPIDTVFSRCNCDGKTFFLKGSQYWRFTNDVMDKGYPKQIAKGFAGLNGKIIAALPVARYNNRPESVYFIKKGGNMQHYIYRQEPAKKCKKKARVTIRYPARLVIRRRFERAIRTQTVYQTIKIQKYSTGILHDEVKLPTYWRGFPKTVYTALSIQNYQKPDGYDYYVFSKDQYYNVNVGSRIVRSVTAITGQTVSKDWYKCPNSDLEHRI